MDWMIQWSSLILLTSMTGSMLLIIWYSIGRMLERIGFVHILYSLLKAVLIFFLFPVAYVILYGLSKT